jgi:hypothetical protein
MAYVLYGSSALLYGFCYGSFERLKDNIKHGLALSVDSGYKLIALTPISVMSLMCCTPIVFSSRWLRRGPKLIRIKTQFQSFEFS